jgi:hypothetical protein
MAVRDYNNYNRIIDRTEMVQLIPNQAGYINDSGLFEGEGVATETVIFDREETTFSLLPTVNRRGGAPTKRKENRADTFALVLPYFQTTDLITGSDVQGRRMVGTDADPETVANVMAKKMRRMRLEADQTNEYMKLQALKGKTVAPDGTVIADMFTKFNLDPADYTFNFKLDDATTDVDVKVAEFKRAFVRSAKTGRMGAINALVSPEFFDKLTSHEKVQEAYKYYAANVNPMRDDMQRMTAYGIVDVFDYKGVRFMTYDIDFPMPDGTTQSAFDSNTAVEGGRTFVTGLPEVYRTVWGPANTLEGANQIGQEMFMYQYTDPKGKFIELELEMAPLHWMNHPQLSWNLISTAT